MQLTIKTDFAGVETALKRLQDDIGKRALASAMNKTVDLARTQMTREIAGEFNVTSGYVRERLRVRRAAAKGLVLEAALIGGKGGRRRSANIIAFVEKSVSLAQARKRAKAGTLDQLFVKVKRRGGKKPLRGAFIGNKGRTVFERVGKERLPIKPVQTIDVAQMFNTRKINAAVVRMIRQRFPEVFEREARFYVDRFNRGGK
jgi:hypothetical protein